MLVQFRGNLAMAFDAAERTLAHRLRVALCAVGGAVNAVVRASQCSRRNLCVRGLRQSHGEQKYRRQARTLE
jgi:hypothetical protein